MGNAHQDRGFTIIELLTVIAIIAVLAAIIFPLAGTVREQARESDSMSQLHELWVSAMVYKQDEGVFPPTLLGYVEVNNPLIAASDPNRYYIGASGQTVLPLDHVLNGTLYRQQVNDAAVYQCPNNMRATHVSVTIAHWPARPANWPANQAWIGDQLAAAGCPTDAYGTVDCWNSLTPPVVQSTDPRYLQPKYYYTWDSYSIGPRVGLDGNGNPVAAIDASGNPVYDVHYSTDWTGEKGYYEYPAGSGNYGWDLSDQLKYADPPADKTLFALTTWNFFTAKSPSVTAISLSGTARKIPLDQFVRSNANVYNP